MSLVKQAIIAELQELIPKSKHYADQLETAKTKVKKDLMRKRLKKNNEKVADLLVALDKLDKKEKENEDAVPERGVEKTSATEEPVD